MKDDVLIEGDVSSSGKIRIEGSKVCVVNGKLKGSTGCVVDGHAIVE
jgi:cytoskeletal protein CcmA (bactofilin family)